MKLTSRHLHRLGSPGLLLLALLQRTPACPGLGLGLAAEAPLLSSVGLVLRAVFTAAASLGATHALAGATQFVINPASPIAGTVGQPITGVAFTYTGTPSPPASFRITGSLPPGLSISGLSGGVVNSGTPVITGTPTQAGTFSFSVKGYNTPGGTGLTNDVQVPITFNIAAGTTPPAFSTQPLAQSANVGATVTFTASASGIPAPTYQWRKDGASLAGATASALTLSNIQLADAGTYAVVATNSAGSATSNGAVLSVIVPAVAPTITTQPANQNVLTGATVTFTVAASGTPAPTFQWRRNGAGLPNATGASLVLANAQPGDSGTYSVVATNSAGSATSNGAVLAVTNPTAAPIISVQPVDQTALAGETVTLASGAFGTPVPTLQWRRNGTVVPGATNATLILANLQPADAGSYVLTATNTAGATTSRAAVVTVTLPATAPAFTTQPASQAALTGQSVSFTVGVTGNPAPALQWRRNGADLAGATSATLTLANLAAAQAGTYAVVATNAVGTATSAGATLTVTPAPAIPVFTVQPVSQTVAVGQSVSFTVSAAGTPTPALQWRRNGQNLAGATSATLTLASVQAGDAGNYSAVAINSAGAATSNDALLTVAVTTPTVDPGRLVNLSILTALTGGDDAFTLGVVIGGAGTSGTTPLLVRAAGPALAQFGISDGVTDPRLELFAGATRTAANDNWGGAATLRNLFAQTGAFPFPDATSADAAVYDPAMRPGDTSARISAPVGAGGAVLVELYDATPPGAATPASPRLVNVSVLKDIGSGLTAGFVIGGGTATTVLIRAIGPTLAGFGVDRFLPDPRLELLAAGGGALATNDDWGGNPAFAAAFASVGAFALSPTSRDAAVLARLQPGSYTVRVSDGAAATGVALIEIYEVP